MRHAFAHVADRQRLSGTRFDDLEEGGVLQRKAVRLQADFDDGLADVIGDGGFSRPRRKEEERENPPQNSFLTLISTA